MCEIPIHIILLVKSTILVWWLDTFEYQHSVEPAVSFHVLLIHIIHIPTFIDSYSSLVISSLLAGQIHMFA